jgi:hypothetical protein
MLKIVAVFYYLTLSLPSCTTFVYIFIAEITLLTLVNIVKLYIL